MHIYARPSPTQPGVINLTQHTTPVADIYEPAFLDLLTSYEREKWNNRHREFNLPIQRIKENSINWYYNFAI